MSQSFSGQRGRSSILRALSLSCALALASAAVPASAQEASASEFTKAKYPIVLVHGLFGSADAWPKIPQALKEGGATVYTVTVSAANSTEVRGEQLRKQVEIIRALTGKDKVNLIGQSHGGPTVRYVAGVAPDWVASVIAIAGPHKGAPGADEKLKEFNAANWIQQQWELGTYNSLGRTISNSAPGDVSLRQFNPLDPLGLLGLSDLPQDALAAVKSLSTAGAAEFTKKFPQGMALDAQGKATGCADGPARVNGVRYYSWSGTKTINESAEGDPWLKLLLEISGVSRDLFGNAENDGLVGVCSSKLGESLGNQPLNHIQEVNADLGLRDPNAPDVPSLYRMHVNKLRQAGL